MANIGETAMIRTIERMRPVYEAMKASYAAGIAFHSSPDNMELFHAAVKAEKELDEACRAAK